MAGGLLSRLGHGLRRAAVLGGLGAKASAVSRHIAWGSIGTAVWTPKRYDLLAKEAYTKNAIAYSCVNEIAKGVSQPPLLVYERAADGSRREVPGHPVAQLLRRPNPSQSRARLLYDLAAFLAISGNAYLEGVGPETGPNRGRPLELWTKRPDRMRVVPGEAGVMAYEHEVNGQLKRWEVDPITYRSGIKHLKLFHPLDDWYGLSPIEVASMDVDAHNETRTWNQALLQNSARPSGALMAEARLTDVQYHRLKSEVIEQYTGPRNAGRPLLLDGGLTWQQFSFSPKDMEFLESKNTSARDICTAFGVPPMLLGIPGDNTYSNYREARQAFFDNTVSSYLQALADELTAWLLGDEPDLELGFDLDAVPAMAYRREQMFDRATKASFLTLNEARDMAGFGKLDGDTGEVVLVPSTMRPLEHALIEPPDPVEMAGAVAAARAGAAPEPGSPQEKPQAGAKPKPEAKPKPKPAANDKAAIGPTGPALLATLRDAKAEAGMNRVQFALWLQGEGLSEQEAAGLAAMAGED